MIPTADRESMDALAEGYYLPLYRFAFSLSGNPADAADLTQETFYIAQTRIHQLRDAGKVKTWLFTTLLREFLQKRRHETKFPKFELEEVSGELPNITSDQVARMDSGFVVAALHSLEETYRAPLVLFYLDGMAYKDIARVLKLRIGTVMSRLARGKEQLRRKLAVPVQERECGGGNRSVWAHEQGQHFLPLLGERAGRGRALTKWAWRAGVGASVHPARSKYFCHH